MVFFALHLKQSSYGEFVSRRHTQRMLPVHFVPSYVNKYLLCHLPKTFCFISNVDTFAKLSKSADTRTLNVLQPRLMITLALMYDKPLFYVDENFTVLATCHVQAKQRDS